MAERNMVNLTITMTREERDNHDDTGRAQGAQADCLG